MSERADRLLRLLTRADRLESLPRTGWIVGGVQQPESIAAHLYGVALVSLWLCDVLEERVNTEEVLRIALLHDLGEALTTDLPRPVKRLLGKKLVDEAEEVAFASIAHDAGVPWLGSFDSYRLAETLEARIVKAADRIQMLAKAATYEKQGRGDVDRFFDSPDPDYGIPIVAEILNRIRERRSQKDWFDADFD